MYRFVSLVFAVLFFFSCSSDGNGTDSKTDSDNISGITDNDSGEIPEENDSDFNTDSDSGSETTDDTSDHDFSSDGDSGFIEEDSDSFDDSDAAEGSETDTEIPTDEDSPEEPEEIDDFDGDSIQIRIVAGNISSRKENVCSQCYDPGHVIRIFQALKPDIALVQEMNYKNNSTSDYKSFAQQIVGTNYYAVDSADYQIPNGVVSRYPITSHGYWKDPNISNRALMWAVVDIPGNTDIFAISVHLHTSPDSDQVKAAQVIVDEIAKVKANNPGKYYYVVGGDFNGTSAVSSNGFGKNNTFYVDGPHPVDVDDDNITAENKGNSNTNSGRKNHYDFVLADYPLHGFQVPTVYYSSEDSTKTKSYANGLVFDTRVYTQSVLDEYFSPAQTSDSKADEMQHMAVVKDFLIELR